MAYLREPETFSSSSAPSNYVAGLGRGAIGFTTRADLGPAQAGRTKDGPVGLTPDFGQAPAGYIAGAGRGSGGFGETKPRQESLNQDGADYSETHYDEFSGFSGSLFANATYDKDDEEADKIWESVDKKMSEKRKRQREKREQQEKLENRKVRPKIADQFADLKQQLGSVKAEEWDAIPEASTGVRHRRKQEFLTHITDSMITSARDMSGTGLESKSAYVQPGGDSTSLSAARDQVLRLNLDKMSDSVSGQTVVDPKGYMTQLNSQKISSTSEISDIKKARLLYKSVTSTNPKHAPGWIAAARLEEVAGKLLQARLLIQKGCDSCPENEDVWLEAARLQTPDQAKAVLAHAVKKLPKSVKIWMQAAELESVAERKKNVLRKALELIPNSVKLWQALIELEDNEEDAKVLLARATECVPHSVDMWLALSRLETYTNGKIVLNKAREKLPTEARIWIAACQLEESQGHTAMLPKLMSKAVKKLTKLNVVIARSTWMKHALDAEDAGSPKTCAAILQATLGIGVEDVDKIRTFVDDANSCEASGHIEAARAIFAYTLELYPAEQWIWLRYVTLERKHGTNSLIQQVLKKATANCPESEILWLMAAKETWLGGDVVGARTIILQAFQTGHNSEKIWLAAAKLEWENQEYERAKGVLSKAREKSSTARVWMKSALLERELGNTKQEEEFVMEAIKKYPKFAKLRIMAGQVAERRGDINTARKRYLDGLESCSNSPDLWIVVARFEEKHALKAKVRSVLETARLKNPKNAALWLEAVRFEVRNKDKKLAETLLAKALKECPKSGELWAEQIFMVPRPEQRGKSVDALNNCDDNPHVVLAIAKLFWRDRKLRRARKWFHRAVTLDPDLGDAWATYYKFELDQSKKDGNNEEKAKEIVERCKKADPHHGELWCSISKDTKNARVGCEQILKLTAQLVRVDM